jgi:hypothetical protein
LEEGGHKTKNRIGPRDGGRAQKVRPAEVFRLASFFGRLGVARASGGLPFWRKPEYTVKVLYESV